MVLYRLYGLTIDNKFSISTKIIYYNSGKIAKMECEDLFKVKAHLNIPFRKIRLIFYSKV